MAAVGTGDKNCLLNNKDLEELCHHINTKHRVRTNCCVICLDVWYDLMTRPFYYTGSPTGTKGICPVIWDPVFPVSWREWWTACGWCCDLQHQVQWVFSICTKVSHVICHTIPVTLTKAWPHVLFVTPFSCFYRYSIKGPVYLKDKNGQVVTPSCHADAGVTFGPGNFILL